MSSDSGDRRPVRSPQIPAPEQENLACPRCDSTNTKFCYYNNYNLSQPRHFCKSCRRYWTQGGALRNVPVGGGSRSNKRPRSSQPAPSTAVLAARSEPGPDCKGSFASLLATSASASGPGLEEMDLGGVWPVGDLGDTWQIGNGEDCFSWLE
ncbi:hypothetical protein ACLOJK_003002 [Asimina triloba]